jgi:hypothetical protein
MLRLKSFTEDHDRSMVRPNAMAGDPTSALASLHFHCASGFATQTLAHMLDSLVRVSRRDGCNHFFRVTLLRLAQGGKAAMLLDPKPRWDTTGYNTSKEATSPRAVYLGVRIDAKPARRTEQPPMGSRKIRHANTSRNRFPFSDFRDSLTLFSKFFSSFLHSTCSLSVSRRYLALEGIYLPL